MNDIRLNLGCGETYLDNWINIDYSSKYKTDYLLDLGKSVLPFNDDSAVSVISSHLIEHLNRKEGIFHLKEIFRLLRPDKRFYLVFPDIKKIVNVFNGNEGPKKLWNNQKWLIRALYETQVDETVIHKYGYTYQRKHPYLVKFQ